MSASWCPGVVACGVGSREPPGQSDRQTDTPLSISLYFSVTCFSGTIWALYKTTHAPTPSLLLFGLQLSSLSKVSFESQLTSLQLMSLSVCLSVSLLLLLQDYVKINTGGSLLARFRARHIDFGDRSMSWEDLVTWDNVSQWFIVPHKLPSSAGILQVCLFWLLSRSVRLNDQEKGGHVSSCLFFTASHFSHWNILYQIFFLICFSLAGVSSSFLGPAATFITNTIKYSRWQQFSKLAIRKSLIIISQVWSPTVCQTAVDKTQSH